MFKPVYLWKNESKTVDGKKKKKKTVDGPGVGRVGHDRVGTGDSKAVSVSGTFWRGISDPWKAGSRAMQKNWTSVFVTN